MKSAHTNSTLAAALSYTPALCLAISRRRLSTSTAVTWAPCKANWLVFPPTPQNASTTVAAPAEAARRAIWMAMASGVTENQPVHRKKAPGEPHARGPPQTHKCVNTHPLRLFGCLRRTATTENAAETSTLRRVPRQTCASLATVDALWLQTLPGQHQRWVRP